MPTGSLASARPAPTPDKARSSVRSLRLFPRADRRVPIPVAHVAVRAMWCRHDKGVVFILPSYEQVRRRLSKTCKRVAKQLAVLAKYLDLARPSTSVKFVTGIGRKEIRDRSKGFELCALFP